MVFFAWYFKWQSVGFVGLTIILPKKSYKYLHLAEFCAILSYSDEEAERGQIVVVAVVWRLLGREFWFNY